MARGRPFLKNPFSHGFTFLLDWRQHIGYIFLNLSYCVHSEMAYPDGFWPRRLAQTVAGNIRVAGSLRCEAGKRVHMDPKRTSKRRAAFLQALELGYSATFARKKAGLERAELMAWRADEQDFDEDWDEALEDGTDMLEDLARERVATGGDSLLMFLLKSRRPEKYRERHDHQVDASVVSGVLIAPAAIDLETWSKQAANQAVQQGRKTPDKAAKLNLASDPPHSTEMANTTN